MAWGIDGIWEQLCVIIGSDTHCLIPPSNKIFAFAAIWKLIIDIAVADIDRGVGPGRVGQVYIDQGGVFQSGANNARNTAQSETNPIQEKRTRSIKHEPTAETRDKVEAQAARRRCPELPQTVMVGLR